MNNYSSDEIVFKANNRDEVIQSLANYFSVPVCYINEENLKDVYQKGVREKRRIIQMKIKYSLKLLTPAITAETGTIGKTIDVEMKKCKWNSVFFCQTYKRNIQRKNFRI